MDHFGRTERYSLPFIFKYIYLNPTNGFIGINASGKTSILKVILLVLGIIDNEPINHIETRDVLGDASEALFNIYFMSDSLQRALKAEIPAISVMYCMRYLLMRMELSRISEK